MSVIRLERGKTGEDQACRLLLRRGYRILERNYRTRFGEIDIIACDRDVICFIEVKYRSSDRAGSPAESVGWQKQRRMSKAALAYLKENKFFERSCRFDVVAVTPAAGGFALEIIRNAFYLDSSFTY